MIRPTSRYPVSCIIFRGQYGFKARCSGVRRNLATPKLRNRVWMGLLPRNNICPEASWLLHPCVTSVVRVSISSPHSVTPNKKQSLGRKKVPGRASVPMPTSTRLDSSSGTCSSSGHDADRKLSHWCCSLLSCNTGTSRPAGSIGKYQKLPKNIGKYQKYQFEHRKTCFCLKTRMCRHFEWNQPNVPANTQPVKWLLYCNTSWHCCVKVNEQKIFSV